MQNFAACVLTDSKKFDRTTQVLQELRLLFIPDQLLAHNAIQMYNIVNDYVLSYFSSFVR